MIHAEVPARVLRRTKPTLNAQYRSRIHECPPSFWGASEPRINGHDSYAYLKDVLERLTTHPASRIDDLLPHRWLTGTPSAVQICVLTALAEVPTKVFIFKFCLSL
jgi:hypothetical protein